jgi:hypothetical protein
MSDGSHSPPGKAKNTGKLRRPRCTVEKPSGTTGKLRIRDNLNAITIIALTQNNPLNAIAEFVENSIDAKAKLITIIRGKDRGEPYLKIVDDGEGIRCGAEGAPVFKYMATQICDSLKRRLKAEGFRGIQGEFGIGLLHFWTVGERMVLSSLGADGKIYQFCRDCDSSAGRKSRTISPRSFRTGCENRA